MEAAPAASTKRNCHRGQNGDFGPEMSGIWQWSQWGQWSGFRGRISDENNMINVLTMYGRGLKSRA
jgi:hypothetical protein